jgi:hypothetical protein
MNREQARHAESIARHMLNYVDHFAARLRVVQRAWQEQEYEQFPVHNAMEVFQREKDYMAKELEMVNRDMLAQLEDM